MSILACTKNQLNNTNSSLSAGSHNDLLYEITGYSANNCGANVLASALYHNGINTKTLEQIINRSKYYQNSLSPINMADLVVVLKESGLESLAYKNVSEEEIIEFMKIHSRGVILHLQNMGPANHYIFCRLNKEKNKISIDDYPRYYEKSISDFRKSYKSYASGYVVVITNKNDILFNKKNNSLLSTSNFGNAQVKQYEKDPILGIAREILAGIPTDSVETIVSVPIENPTDAILQIKSVKGDCSCFVGADHAKKINPQLGSDIKIRLASKKVSVNGVNIAVKYEVFNEQRYANFKIIPYVQSVNGVQVNPLRIYYSPGKTTVRHLFIQAESKHEIEDMIFTTNLEGVSVLIKKIKLFREIQNSKLFVCFLEVKSNNLIAKAGNIEIYDKSGLKLNALGMLPARPLL